MYKRQTVHRANNYENILNFKSKDDPLAGGAKYFFPWLAVFTLVAYPMGNKAWQGKFRYFQVLGLSYYIPTLIICAFFQPSLPLAFFLLFYPAYLLFLTAKMCIRDRLYTASHFFLRGIFCFLMGIALVGLGKGGWLR